MNEAAFLNSFHLVSNDVKDSEQLALFKDGIDCARSISSSDDAMIKSEFKIVAVNNIRKRIVTMIKDLTVSFLLSLLEP